MKHRLPSSSMLAKTLLLFMLITPSIGMAQERIISLPTVSGNPGQEIEIEVSIDNAKDVRAYRIVLNLQNYSDRFPLEYVQGSSTGEGTLTSGWGPPVENDQSTNPDSGLVIITGVAGQAPALPAGSGVLLKFNLRIKDNARNGRVDLFLIPDLTRLNDDAIPSNTIKGSLRIDATYLWGDLNRDLVPGPEDAQQILEYDALLRRSFEGHYDTKYNWPRDFPSEGNVSGDRTLGAYDAWLIYQYDDFQINWFPADLDKNGFGPDEPLQIADPSTPKLLSLSNTSSIPGEEIELAVNVNDATRIASYRIVVDFPDVSPGYPLEYVVNSATGKGTLTDSWPPILVNDRSKTEGYIIFVNMAESFSPLESGAGSLLKFRVRVSPEADRGSIPINFASRSEETLVSRINDGLIPSELINGNIEVLDTPHCGVEFVLPGFVHRKTLQPTFRMLLPNETKPVFSTDGDMIIAASADGQSNMISKILHSSPNGEFREVATLRNPSSDNQILNLLVAGRNQVCAIVGNRATFERCLVFFNVPFELSNINDFMMHN